MHFLKSPIEEMSNIHSDWWKYQWTDEVKNKPSNKGHQTGRDRSQSASNLRASENQARESKDKKWAGFS